MRFRLLLVVLVVLVAGCAPASRSERPVVMVRTVAVPSPVIPAADGAARAQLARWFDVLAWQQAEAANAARINAARATKPRASGGGGGSGDCANPVISEATARRESGCDWGAFNPTGCSGRGCVGFYQLDRGHFYAQSPWNPSTHGACYGLDPSTREGQTECASRLGPGAWG